MKRTRNALESMLGLQGGPRLSSGETVGTTSRFESQARDQNLRTVLVLLDGSPAAEQALPYALAIARRSGAMVRLVQPCLKSPVWRRVYRRKLSTQHRLAKQAYLQSVAQRIRAQSDLWVTEMVVECDEQMQSLRAAATGSSLVVLAAPGKSLAERVAHCGLLGTLLRKSTCPLLLVPKCEAEMDLSADPVPRRVLVPLDGTQFGERLLDSAAVGNWLGESSFTLAHFQRIGATVNYSQLADLRDYLRAVAERYEKRVRLVNTEMVIGDEYVSSAILELAEDRQMDLIAMATRGRSWLGQLISPSVVKAVVRGATKVPVLILPPLAQTAELSSQARTFSRVAT